MPADLRDRADVAELVTAFYRAAFDDPLIGPIFTDVAHMDLDHHLPIMCDFWETVLFDVVLYRRNALQLHAALHARHPLKAEHFDRWLTLWVETVDARFAGPVAERAKVQARRIAGSIGRRLDGRTGTVYDTILSRDRAQQIGIDTSRSGQAAP